MDTYANVETFLTMTWTMNTEPVMKIITDYIKENKLDKNENNITKLKDRIVNMLEEIDPKLFRDLQFELLSRAVDRIDFEEIAESWLEDSTKEYAESYLENCKADND